MEKNLKTHVMKLSEEIGERNYVYYEELNKAADYLTEEFKRYGYDPSAQEYTIDNRVFKNIIAVKEGKIKPEEIVIIGAHYDSVIGSPGANDNGSAVAAMLELARMFSKVDTERTVKFIAFTNEEPPFYLTGQMGSRIYAKSARERGDDIKAMVSLETIGYYSEARNSQSYPFFYGLFYPDQANFIGVVG
ncbi:MAG: M28 family peptidase, partial [Candidatus Omnitrophota bacterium]